MSPRYLTPTTDSFRQGGQFLTIPTDNQREQQIRDNLTRSPSDRTRPTSARSDVLFNRKPRSASPQVHPLLMQEASSTSSSVADDLRRSNTMQAARHTLRRYASTDLLDLKTASYPGAVGGREYESPTSRDQRAARLPPMPSTPRRPTPLRFSSFQESSRRKSTIQESQESGGEDQGRVSTPGNGPHSDAEVAGRADGVLRYIEHQSASTTPRNLTNTRHHSDDIPAWISPDTDDSPRSSSAGSSTPSSQLSAASPQSTISSAPSTDADNEEDEVPKMETEPCSAPAITTQYAQPAPTRGHKQRPSYLYGTPEMPRGNAKLPHLPVTSLTNRVPYQSFASPLPRAEKLPKSGYGLLASNIASVPRSSSRASGFPDNTLFGGGSRQHSSVNLRGLQDQAEDSEGSTVKPIYRRFESLNHRLLLHLQDELSELEEQLNRLDTTDTQTRRVQGSILPASRRAEVLAGGELQAQKADILTKIAAKLVQYNQALSSFTSTRDLPAPAQASIHEYRNFLSTHRPISDDETRFLDAPDDLITLEAPVCPTTTTASKTTTSSRSAAEADAGATVTTTITVDDDSDDGLQHLQTLRSGIVTPIPGTMHGNSWLMQRHNRLCPPTPGARSCHDGSSSPRFPPSLRRTGSGASNDGCSSPRFPPSLRRTRSGASNDGCASPMFAPSSQSQQTSAVKQPPTASQTGVRALLVRLALAVMVAAVLAWAALRGFVARMGVVFTVGAIAIGLGVKRTWFGAVGLRGEFAACGVGLAVGMAVVAGFVA